MDFEEICRLCCEKKTRMRSILAEVNTNFPLTQVFIDILRLEVYAEDGLPQKICKVCSITLEKLYKTVETFRKNDLMLRKQLLGVTHVEIKEEEMEIERLEEAFTQELIVIGDEEVEIKNENPECAPGNDSSLNADNEPEESSEEQILSDENTPKKRKPLQQKKGTKKPRKQRKPTEGKNKSTKLDKDQPTIKRRRKRHIPEYDNPNLPRLNDHKCYICKSESLGSGEALLAHLNSHSHEVPTTCKICVQETVEINNVTTLNIHKRMHENPYKCPYCDRRYSIKRSIDLHVQMYHLGDNAPCPSTCDHCGKVCPSKLSLKNHIKIHTKAISCEFCGKVFATNHKLRLHIERIHEGIKKYECHLCQKKLKSLDSVQVHIATMHSKSEFKCEYCPKSYSSDLALRYHEKKHVENPNFIATNDWKKYYTFVEGEDGTKLKKCNLCGVIAKSMAPHLTAIHFPQEFRCELCDVVFKRKNLYDIHMKEHENGKAYRCPICGREFTLRKNLLAHLKTQKHRDHPLAQSLDWLYKKNKKPSMKEEPKVDQNEDISFEGSLLDE